MPRNSTRVDEYPIFVKNVPQDLATEAVPEFFNQYEPLHIKNVYPHSHTTTVVVYFATLEAALDCQVETDGMRLENVVLSVEPYNTKKSVRHLREERVAKRYGPMGVIEEDDGDSEEQEQEDLPGYITPTEPAAQYKVPEGGTWAQIAGHKKFPTGMAPFPPPSPALSPHTRPAKLTQPAELTAISTETPVPTPRSTPHIAVAVPRLLESAQSHRTASEGLFEDTAADSLDTSLNIADEGGIQDEVAENATDMKPRKPTPKYTAPTWGNPMDTIDTAERMRQVHCRNCFLCQMRMRHL
jgi:hypothetical protein